MVPDLGALVLENAKASKIVVAGSVCLSAEVLSGCVKY